MTDSTPATAAHYPENQREADRQRELRLRHVEGIAAQALVKSHDNADCDHGDVDGDQQCPDCDARWVIEALDSLGYLNA